MNRRRLLLDLFAWYARHMPAHPGSWRIARLAASLAHELSFSRRPVTFRLKDGIRLKTDGRSQTGRIAYATGLYEPAVAAMIRRRLRPGDTFVDVGANIGYFSILAARAVGPRGRVLAFEPSPHVRRALEENLSLNHIGNVVVRAEALGPTRGEVSFFTGPTEDTGLGSLRPLEHGQQIFVTQRPFDELAEDVSRISMVKIDVEGGEVGVLAGMSRVLATARPDIIVEFTDAFLRGLGSSAVELLSLLHAHGYHVCCVHDNGHLVPIQNAEDLEELPPQFNAWCSVLQPHTEAP